ncbi:BTB domain and ankyrin repeat protein [Aspergillus vadensis CBS 113365]|uniref:BTB domain and ankyrin repeat protein n=1 Tax=Aspergillus vadensis (strain CBS 113365 / IMI 142717 / IBT 24658) TaxID=1448311 RepID=A0A319BPG8_ASPVC|nr:BTB domain and ankyrin repeat protein [Aspergillus vadensis CBS 113365]PYH67603.1 BTB domain and ankyrin repeat protein [Aspergillus vadensis CBS 113365]
MSSKLWGFFFYDDVESFRRFLATATYTTGGSQRTGTGGASPFKPGSPGSVIASSPGTSTKSRKLTGTSPGTPIPDRGGSLRPGKTLSREELNARDHHGRTLLHHVASSPKDTAIEFAIALLEIPALDIYAQDWESGWTALHRALYAGNATIAQALMARDMRDATDFSKASNPGHPSGGLIRIKDREGYSPFDVYGATIATRDIKRISPRTTAQAPLLADMDNSDAASDVSSHGEGFDEDSRSMRSIVKPRTNLSGDEVFTFGSNKNLNLGVGDQDDRQYPERITLKRPEHLLQRFYREFLEQRSNDDTFDPDQEPGYSTDLPALIKNKPIKIQNIVMSKLHTAILTTDPESNLFLCGFGPGGRLGTGDESTRFSFVCIDTGGLANRRVVSVALGQDHTLAITDRGEIFSWGSNKFGQLGYSLPRSNNRDDVPIQNSPRQIFNPFKKEVILGAAASAIHSVVFSTSGLYTFGKNEGQLGLVDSDARSLELQTTPRRVGASLFSAPIQSVSAIDQATAVLLQNHEVWVFSQYGYSKLLFPLDVSSRFIKDSFMATRYGSSVNEIVQVKSGGNTICALSSFGEVYTVQVNKTEHPPVSTSTTNPSKTRNSLSQPTRVWSIKKAHMAAADVDVGQDGSIVICTVSGSAWRKEKRGKTKDGASKDYKFARVPGLSRVIGVSSNAFGAYAAVQRDSEVTKEQISVDQSTLWKDLLPLSPFNSLQETIDPRSQTDENDVHTDMEPNMAIRRAVMSSSEIEPLFQTSQSRAPPGTVWLRTSQSDIQVPVHEFILTGRSMVLRKAFQDFRGTGHASVPDTVTIQRDDLGQTHVIMHNVDVLTVLNIAFFVYTDSILDVWQQVRYSPESASRYRQVRSEVMRIASHLGLSTLERAARLMIEPTKSLKVDMERAIRDPAFFDSADVVIELNGSEVKAHSQVICQRCPFFNALFFGRSEGMWLLSRRADPEDMVHIDLRHFEPNVFNFVLRYMYADTEAELFDDVRSRDLEDFIDLVLDVAFVANELMIDRLAQICQKMLGMFVNTRSVCHLLNAIAPCFVTEFKDAALEYICLNLEDLLANRLLEDLDDILLGALDTVCRDNQMASFPVSRGRNTEEYVFEKYPEVVSLIEEDRKRRIDSMRIRSRLNRIDAFEGKPRMTSNEKAAASPLTQRVKATPAKDSSTPASGSPLLKSRQSVGDLMFQMDDEYILSPGESGKGKGVVREDKTPAANKHKPSYDSPALGSSLVDGDSFGGRSYLDDQMASSRDLAVPDSPSETRAASLYKKRNGSLTPPDAQPPWSSSALSSSKKSLKDIMSEASENRVSNLSLGMGARRENSNATSKLSQKERKKIQQQQMQDMLAAQQKAKEGPQNPWKLPSTSSPAPVNEQQASPSEGSARSTPKPSMTLRQTVAGTPPPGTNPKTTPVQGQGRSTPSKAQTPSKPSHPVPSTAAPSPSNPSANPQPPIQSIRHIPRPEPYQTSFHTPSSNSLSLATILMQQQTEKEELHEAATAKHNLEDIQLEQQFQEWWDKESRRVQGLPEPGSAPDTAAQEARDARGNRGRGKGQGHQQRKRRGKGDGPNGTTDNSTPQSSQPQPPPSQPPRKDQRQQQQQQKKTQSAPRREQQPQRPQANGNHPDTASGSSRRGGRGAARGRGNRERGKVA